MAISDDLIYAEGKLTEKTPAAARYRLSKVRQKRPHAPKKKIDLGNFSGTFGNLQNCHTYFPLAPYGGLFFSDFIFLRKFLTFSDIRK